MKSASIQLCLGLLFMATLLQNCARKPSFIGVENVQVLGVRDSLLQLRLDYVVFNPNKASAELKDSEMLIFYKNELVGKGRLESTTQLEARDTIRIPVRFDVILPRLVGFYPELLASESSTFTVKGKNKVSFVIDDVRMRFNDKVEIDTREIIRSEVSKRLKGSDNFRFKSVKIKPAAKVRSTDFETVIRIYNDLPFDYTVHGMELDFFLKKKDDAIAHWSLAKPVLLSRNSYVDIPANLRTDNVNLLRGLNLNWLFTRKVDFFMAGEVEVEIERQKFTLPIEDKQSIDITQLVGLK